MAKWNNIIAFAGSTTDNTGSVEFDGDSTITGSLFITQNITASGNISASGDIIVGNITSNGLGGVNILGGLEVGPTLQFQTQSSPPTVVEGALYVDSDNNLYIGQ